MKKTDWNSQLTPILSFLILAMVMAVFSTSCTSMKQRAAERKAALTPPMKVEEKPTERTHAEKAEENERRAKEPDPLPSDVTEIAAPVPDNDPEKAYFCEFQALITKFEAYGATLEQAQAKVKELCTQKFGPAHCVDEEDLRCRKTFFQ